MTVMMVQRDCSLRTGVGCLSRVREGDGFFFFPPSFYLCGPTGEGRGAEPELMSKVRCRKEDDGHNDEHGKCRRGQKYVLELVVGTTGEGCRTRMIRIGGYLQRHLTFRLDILMILTLLMSIITDLLTLIKHVASVMSLTGVSEDIFKL